MAGREETLREAACNGDLDTTHALLAGGINVNHQHPMNHW